jgi:hypothetical protein
VEVTAAAAVNTAVVVAELEGGGDGGGNVGGYNRGRRTLKS